MESVSEEKRLLRDRIKAFRKAVSSEEKRLWDEKLKERFFALLTEGTDWLAPGGQPLIYLYLDIRNEAGTAPIIKELWSRGIRTAVPRVEGTEMKFYEVQDWKDVSRGCMGIQEPVSGLKPVLAEEGIVLVPGVAFDVSGGRLGYGGGFYDRFFQREPKHPRWGLAYDFQIVKSVPQEPWDRKMDAVITPNGVCSGDRNGSI